MPIDNFRALARSKIRRAGVLSRHMNELRNAQFIDPCFAHGHFGLVPAATNEPIREVIHYQSQLKAALPYGMVIPTGDVALACETASADLQLAVNRQPGNRQGNSLSSLAHRNNT